MRFMLSILLLVALAACGRPGDPEPPLVETPPGLAALAARYESLQPGLPRVAGFVDTDRCDSLLRSALIAAGSASPSAAQIEAAEASPGRWLRRPKQLPECWSAGESRSTISRDQLLGALWWAWSAYLEGGEAGRARAKRVVRDLWFYGAGNQWLMGEGRYGSLDTYFSPNFRAILGRLCLRMAAACEWEAYGWAHMEPVYWGSPTGYERQLEVLQVQLWWELTGRLPRKGLERLRQQADESTWSPLYATVLAIHGLAPAEDVDERLKRWPQNRLPQSADWCSHWLIEEEGPMSSGWSPCPEQGRVHSGGEVLLLRRLFQRPTER